MRTHKVNNSIEYVDNGFTYSPEQPDFRSLDFGSFQAYYYWLLDVVAVVVAVNVVVILGAVVVAAVVVIAVVDVDAAFVPKLKL